MNPTLNLLKNTAIGTAKVGGRAAVGVLGLGLTAGAALGLVGAAATEVALMATQKEHIRVGSMNFPVYGLKSSWGRALTAGAMGIGVGMGINNYRKSKWNLSQSLYNGNLEVESSNMLGATGSMALAMSKRGRARINGQELPVHPNHALTHALINSVDDVAMMFGRVR